MVRMIMNPSRISTNSNKEGISELINNNPQKEKTTIMIPVAQCIGSVDDTITVVRAAEPRSVPVAQCVTVTVDANQGLRPSGHSEGAQIELMPSGDTTTTINDNFNFRTLSVQSFVTPENERTNMTLFGNTPSLSNTNSIGNSTGAVAQNHDHHHHQNTITGDELLSRLKQHRKQATIKSGFIGGIVGLLVLGPIGALGIGAGSAVITKHRLKRREKSLRKQLDGRLHQPLPVLSNSNCHRHWHH